MLQVKTKELEKLLTEIGISKNEIAQALDVTRSSLWRWIRTGDIPERAYVFLSIVRFNEDKLGLRRVSFNPIQFKDTQLQMYAEEIQAEFRATLAKQLGESVSINLDGLDTSTLIAELKRRNPDEQVIIARVKSLS